MDVNRFLKKKLCLNFSFSQQQFSILQKAVVVETNGWILAVLEGFFTFVEGKRDANGGLRR